MSRFHGRVGAVYTGQPYCLEVSSTGTGTIADDTDFAFPADLCIEMWISASAAPNANTPLVYSCDEAFDGSTATGWSTYIESDTGVLRISAPSNSNLGNMGSDWVDGELHHVLIHTSGGSGELLYGYLDNVLKIDGESCNSAWDSTSDIIIGGAGGTGYLHQLRIYNATASATQISDLYAGKKVLRANCVGDWRFGDGSGTDVYDMSGEGNNCTLSTTDLWNSANATSDMLNLTLGFYSWNLTYACDEHDCTEFGDPTNAAPYPRKFIGGLTNWTATAERYWRTPEFHYKQGEEVFLRLYWDEPNARRYEGWAIVTGVNTNTPIDDLVTQTITFRGRDLIVIEKT